MKDETYKGMGMVPQAEDAVVTVLTLGEAPDISLKHLLAARMSDAGGAVVQQYPSLQPTDLWIVRHNSPGNKPVLAVYTSAELLFIMRE